MSKKDWVIIFRRTPLAVGHNHYYFDLTFAEMDIKLLAKSYYFDYEDEGGYYYAHKNRAGYTASVLKRGDATIGKVKRKATINGYK